MPRIKRHITSILGQVIITCVLLYSCQNQPTPKSINTNVVPDITFVNEEGKTENLSLYYKQKPILLIISKGTECSMCIMNLQQWSQRAARIQSYGWDIIALSNDNVGENNKALQRDEIENGYHQPGGKFAIKLFSDKDHHAMELLQCYRRELDTERHGIFAINQRGQILFSEISRRPFENYEQIFDSLRLWKKKKV